MPNIQCPKCNKSFIKKFYLDRHLNKKNSCQPLVHDTPQEPAQNSQKTAQNPREPSLNHQNGTLPNGTIAIKNILNENTVIQNNLPNIQNNIPNIQNNIPIIENDNINIQIDNYQCQYCNKSFARKDNAHRHIKLYCPVVKQQNKEKQDIFDKLVALEEKNKQLEEAIKNKDKIYEEEIKNNNKQYEENIKKLSEEIKTIQALTINNNSNNNINSNNTVNVINIVPHGEEDLAKNKVDDLMLILSTKKGYNAVLDLITRVHFNANFPEFQNVYIPDIKNNTAMVFDEVWKLKNIEDVISNLHDTKSDYITDNKDIFYKHLNIGEQAVYQRWAESMNNRDSAEFKTYIIDMHKKIKLLMYNNREMVIETKKLQANKKTKTIKNNIK